MPYIQLQDYFGTCSAIHSSDPLIIRDWLLEHIRPLVSANAAMGPVRLTIQPIYAPLTEGGQPVPDWPVGADAVHTKDYLLTQQKLTALRDLLESPDE